MKKLKTLILVLVIIFIIFNIYKLFIKEHKVSYKINKYNIEEHFLTKDKHHYDFTITNKKEKYIYTLEENLRKKKKIITNIKTYKSNNLICIVPTYKKELEKDIYCNLDGSEVSKNYLKDTNNKDFNKILSKSKINLFKESNIKSKYKKLHIYKKNLDNNIYFIWDYKGVYIIDSDDVRYQKILDYDLYDNVLSVSVDRYFVLFENTSVNGIENIYYYDTKKDRLKTFKLKKKLSKDSYINGVVDNLIYITDNKKKKEYTLDIRKRKLKSIDKDQTSYIVYKNREVKELNKSDYFMEKQIFVNNKVNNYKYTMEDNKLYKIRDDQKESKILLLELDNIVEWNIIGDTVVLISEDSIYEYNEKLGLRKILEYNELNYNYKNIYRIGKK